ncbi:MAG: formylmethanofuran dehydrogenase subunit C [Promethearchaeota archaeon]|nr:MAG: formylmethanofuran dehydrogenase subunit C [Candidatus Lokiarchaeota archaeon]
MAEIKLKLKKQPEVPIEAESITPDNFAGKSSADIKKIPIYHGSEIAKLEDFFSISGKSGELNELTIIIDGELSMIKRIGEKMTGGEIIINGDVGMHVGNQMSGGKITVNGNADDWAGAMMKGGELEINGDAGNYVGAAYRGYWKGMMNGKIVVKGKVGVESLLWANGSIPAKRFPTLICGSAGSFLGIHNHGATIIVEGDVDRCAGADQIKGTIVVKGKVSRLLPSYVKIGEVKEIELFNGEKIKGKFIEYSGDHSVKKNHSVADKKTGEIKKGVNGRLYVAA